jgi:N6-adenosine-specific RNA methylase IME4
VKIGKFETHPAADVFPLLEGDEFEALLFDIRDQGLRSPIWLTSGQVLDGRNRLRACLELGVTPVFETYEGSEPMAFVWSQNFCRRHLAPGAEAIARAKAMELFAKEAKARQLANLKQNASSVQANLPERETPSSIDSAIDTTDVLAIETEHAPRREAVKKRTAAKLEAALSATLGPALAEARGQARDFAAKGSNVSSRTVQHAVSVIKNGVPEALAAVERGTLAVSAAAELSKLEPARQREILERANIDRADKERPVRSGLVRAYVKQAQRAEVAKQLEAEPVPMNGGPFRVIVADPPWAYTKREGDATHRGDLPYPPMSTDAICALPVQGLGHEDSVLWLWTTNAFMRDAYRVLDAWGFREKTILTWVKDRIGLGDWLRGQTEHCILAVRGKPTVTLSNQTTVLNGPMREHSRKPDEFYSMVEALCPGSKCEMFCRQVRPGWHAWGAETERFDAAV